MSKMYRNYNQVFILVFFACSSLSEKGLVHAQAVSSSTVESPSQELDRIPLPDESEYYCFIIIVSKIFECMKFDGGKMNI